MSSLHALCWVSDRGAQWVRTAGLLAPHGDTLLLHLAPAPGLGQCCWSKPGRENLSLLHTGTK